jgi:hypothetical protein
MVQAINARTFPKLGRCRPKSGPGQTEKHSERADVFRSSPKNGRLLFARDIKRIEG